MDKKLESIIKSIKKEVLKNNIGPEALILRLDSLKKIAECRDKEYSLLASAVLETYSLINKAPGIVFIEKGGIIKNEIENSTKEFLGVSSGVDVKGRDYHTVFPRQVSQSIKEGMNSIDQIILDSKESASRRKLDLNVASYMNKYGEEKIVRGNINPIVGQGKKNLSGYFLFFTDITEREKAKELIKSDIADETAVYKTIMKADFQKKTQEKRLKIYKNLSKRERPVNFCIVGPGSELAPFHNDPSAMLKLPGGSSIIMLEYNTSKVLPGTIKKAYELELFETYEPKVYFSKENSRKRFIEENKEIAGSLIKPESIINAGTGKISIGESEIIFMEGTFGKPFHNLPDGSISMIDSSLVSHHSSPYKEVFENGISEYYRILADRGRVVYVEGNCDMSYTEKKINQIVKDIAEMTEKPVNFFDEDGRIWGYYDPCNKKNSRLSMRRIAPDYDASSIIFDIKGYVKADIPKKIAKRALLSSSRYPGQTTTENSASLSLRFPLISEKLDEDYNQLIKKVHKFYAPSKSQIEELRVDPGIKRMTLNRVVKEIHQDACGGRVEHYRTFTYSKKVMESAGFRVETILDPRLNANFGILIARK